MTEIILQPKEITYLIYREIDKIRISAILRNHENQAESQLLSLQH